MSGNLLSHSNSFGFEMEKDAAGCRALNRNFIVGGGFMLCKHCGLPLEDAQERGDYKSCPHCSQNCEEHIFYPKAMFGWTEKRVTSNNPTGIQSWCTRCRGNDDGPYVDGIKCSDM